MEFLVRESPLTNLSLDQARLTRAREEAALQRAGTPASQATDRRDGDQAGLRQAANQFEALFFGQLISAMRSTVPENGFWGQDGGAKIYRQLHDQALADRMSGANRLGIAELIVRQFQDPGDSEGLPSRVNRRGVPPRIPPLQDTRGVSAYRRHAALSECDADRVRLQKLAGVVGGAAADSLQRWRHELSIAAEASGLDPALLLAVMVRESGGDPRAVSPRGARGLMQLMPGTAKEMGVADPADPLQNLLGGSRYLGAMLRRYGGDLDLALAAYNAGPGTVDRVGRRIPDFPETQRYVAAVKDLARRLGAQIGTNLVQRTGDEPKQSTPR